MTTSQEQTVADARSKQWKAMYTEDVIEKTQEETDRWCTTILQHAEHDGGRSQKTHPRQTEVEDIHKTAAVACTFITQATMIMMTMTFTHSFSLHSHTLLMAIF